MLDTENRISPISGTRVSLPKLVDRMNICAMIMISSVVILEVVVGRVSSYGFDFLSIGCDSSSFRVLFILVSGCT